MIEVKSALSLAGDGVDALHVAQRVGPDVGLRGPLAEDGQGLSQERGAQ